MKKTIRLGSFLLAFLLLVCTLPVTAWAATTVDLNQIICSAPGHVLSLAPGDGHPDLYSPVHGGIHLKAVRPWDRRAEYPCQPDGSGRHGHGL